LCPGKFALNGSALLFTALELRLLVRLARRLEEGWELYELMLFKSTGSLLLGLLKDPISPNEDANCGVPNSDRIASIPGFCCCIA